MEKRDDAQDPETEDEVRDVVLAIALMLIEDGLREIREREGPVLH